MGYYDPESIMHYPVKGYKYYPRMYFTPSDIKNINILYKCPQAYRRNTGYHSKSRQKSSSKKAPIFYGNTGYPTKSWRNSSSKQKLNVFTFLSRLSSFFNPLQRNTRQLPNN
ncbi:unnamed protein product [Cylicocyclus nassatus]|uniref:Peptidase M12A domain-containing protein n=1 Tax=Cylicocyclus nassatus TaxID=53992 RepID=A0AA36M6X2_CYLNA|nr:unnamed protein product [Cylicocyclus nassatus]